MMDILERNRFFEQYQGTIGWTINRHRSLMESMRMEESDLRQELCIHLLGAIESYDPARGAKPLTYFIKKLRYGVLSLWREQLREKRCANLYAESLTRTYDDGDVVMLELPFEVDYDMGVRIDEFMQTLSAAEKAALARVVNGEDPEDKRHKRFMAIVRRKAMRYRLTGGEM